MLKKVYIPAKKNPKNDELGAWCLMNVRTHTLIKTREQYIEVIQE